VLNSLGVINTLIRFGLEGRESLMVRADLGKRLVRLLETGLRLPQRLRGRAIRAYVLVPEFLESIECRCCRLLSPDTCRGALKVFLEVGRIVQNLEDLRLTDKCGGEEGPTVQSYPG
jgi:hypothetical protein